MLGEELECTVTLLWVLMGLKTVVYMTVNIKIQAFLPETDNFYQKPLTSDYEESKI